MKIIEFLTSQPLLEKLAVTKLKNVKVAYAVGKNLKLMEADITIIQNVRKQILEEFGKPDEKTGELVIEGDTSTADKQFNELLSIDAQFIPHKVKLDDIVSCGYDFAPVEIASLDWMIFPEEE
jgi:hypothetical protein